MKSNRFGIINAMTAVLIGGLLLSASFSSYSAPTYTTAVKNARLDAVTAQIDAGAAAGKLEIGTASMAATLATVTLNDPSASSASGGVLTLSGFPKTVAATGTGTAAAARIRDSNNTDIVTGLTVGTSGADIIVDNTSINSGQNVTINASPTITHALNKWLNGEIDFAQLAAVIRFVAAYAVPAWG